MAYTNNNLYSQIHKQTTDLVVDDDAKLYSALFRLNVSDLLQIELSKIIFINGTNYLINKIENFEATERRLTKVELIKLSTGVPTNISIPQTPSEGSQVTFFLVDDSGNFLLTDSNEKLTGDV